MLPAPVTAQRIQNITGTVRTEDGAPIVDALVSLDAALKSSRRIRTDSTGRFYFTRVNKGRHELGVISIGFSPVEQTIILGDTALRLEITMHRFEATLATVQVQGRRMGVFGTVVARAGFTPIKGATVEILRTNSKTESDSAGHFDLLQDIPPGSYVVFAKRDRFQSRMLTVNVPQDSAVEVLMDMDSASAPGGKRNAMLMAEFEERSHWIGTRSALVTSQDMAGHDGQSLDLAMRYATPFALKGLVLSDAITCIFVDGMPRPYMTAKDIPAGDVAAVEAYGIRSDYTGTAGSRWAPGVQCGDPGAPRPRGVAAGGSSAFSTGLQYGGSSARVRTDNYVRVLMIWLKR
jgi:hypothetical protein